MIVHSDHPKSTTMALVFFFFDGWLWGFLGVEVAAYESLYMQFSPYVTDLSSNGC